jgi:hypothetical protein
LFGLFSGWRYNSPLSADAHARQYPEPSWCLMSNFDDDSEMVTKTRQGNLGTDLSTLDVLFDSGQF